jgi:hypothetical protein
MLNNTDIITNTIQETEDEEKEESLGDGTSEKVGFGLKVLNSNELDN